MARKGSRRVTRRVLIAVVAGAVVLAGAGAGVWALTRPKDAEPERTRTVKAEVADFGETVTASGTLASQHQSHLWFPSASKVESVEVELGQKVAKGQLLATQETTTLAAEAAAAEAAVEAAQSSLDDQEDSDASDAQLASAEAQLASAKSKLASARDDLTGAKMTSPIAGVVAAINISVGERSVGGTSSVSQPGALGGLGEDSSSSADLVVVDTAAWQVEASVSMADVGGLSQGLAVDVLPDGASEAISGKLESISMVASSSSSSSGDASFPIIVLVDGSPSGLFIGGSADLTIHKSKVEALAVPSAAIATADGQASVTVRKDGSDESRKVVLGRTFGTMTEIVEGLEEGEEVVVRLPAEATRVFAPGDVPSGMPTGGPGEMPDGRFGQMPEDGQMPQRRQMPDDGQMPQGGQALPGGTAPARVGG